MVGSFTNFFNLERQLLIEVGCKTHPGSDPCSPSRSRTSIHQALVSTISWIEDEFPSHPSLLPAGHLSFLDTSSCPSTKSWSIWVWKNSRARPSFIPLYDGQRGLHSAT